ncbi:MAG TPA: acetylneuraminic acid synthetase [Clostridia bacterium]|nr:acetylneuraminic acid synthetase [Clostridia bacterium]
MKEIRIGDRIVREGDRPFIIAEIGVNYENSLAMAERMILEAAKAGADAVKFQSYKAETLAAAESPAYWQENRTQREFFKMYDSFGPNEYRYLAEVARRSNVVFLSTPFDKEAVDYLEPLVPAFKVASADITNVDLLRYIASKGKPVLLSTGASTLSEISGAVELLNEYGVTEIVLLHCILHYPTDYGEANLRSIQYLAKAFPDCLVGYSDHTKPDKGMALLTAAALLGASVIEKHFTLDKSKSGNDHYHAMDPADLRCFVDNLVVVWKALGRETREVLGSEISARRLARRSVVSAETIPRGTRIGPQHLTCKRPGTGIDARLIDLVIGRVAADDIAKDTILQWDMFV